MATHKSAEKRHRQSLKKKARNRLAKSTIRTSVKNALVLAKSGKKEEAVKEVRNVNKLLDKAAVHGVLHKNSVRRTISRVTVRVNDILAKSV